MYVTELTSPVGHLLLASDGHSLTGLWLEGQKYYCPIKESMQEAPDNEILKNNYRIQRLVPLDYEKNKSPNSFISSKTMGTASVRPVSTEDNTTI